MPVKPTQTLRATGQGKGRGWDKVWCGWSLAPTRCHGKLGAWMTAELLCVEALGKPGSFHRLSLLICEMTPIPALPSSREM